MENKNKLSALREKDGINQPDIVSHNSALQIQSFRKIQPSVKELVDGILLGNISALSRAITLVESINALHLEKANEVINACLPYANKPAFEWIDKWLANHPYSRTRARSLTVKTVAVDYRERRNESSGTSGSGLDSPGPHRPPGPHWSCKSKPAFSNLPKLLSPGRSAEGDAFRGESA